MHRTHLSPVWKPAAVLSAILAIAWFAVPPLARAQDLEGLQIVVLEGEDSVNIIAQGTAVPTLVEVRDRNDLPVSGASVLFLLGEGGTATLNAGLSQVALTTNALGQAAVTVNPLTAGAVNLSVSATFAGETATAAIVQTNFATAAQAAAAGAGGGAGGGAGAGGGGTGAGTGGAAAGGGAGTGLGTGAIAGIAGAGAAGAAVAARAAGGEDDPRPEPPASPPSAPSAPILTAGDGQLQASWSPTADNGAPIFDYDVRYRAVGGGTWTWLPDTGNDLATTVTIGDLMNGTEYEVQVQAWNSVGGSDWSPSGRGRPVSSARVPDAPGAPTVVAGDGELSVSWRAPSDNGAAISDYDVRYRPAGGDWAHLPDAVNSAATTATIMGLTNGTPYDIQVRASNAVGDGPWSATATGTPMAATTGDIDRAVLVEFYEAMNGPQWSNNTNWNTDTPLDQWYGVSTNANGRVTGLELEANMLRGSLPPSLVSIAALEDLFLPNNQLSGPVPSWLGELGNLHRLYLSGNQLTGSIPPALGNLSNLEGLGLAANQLTGSIPSSLGNLTNLYWLYINDNNLTGTIPSSLGNLGKLAWLYLHNNDLSGSIPPSLQNLTNLAYLALEGNQLSGSVPAWLGNLRGLRWLFLYENQFTGSIPPSLGNLVNLGHLSIGRNQLSGAIPSSLGNLVELEYLALDRNQLSGSIPSSLGDLARLSELYLYQNMLSGSIPASLCQFESTINPQQGSVNLPCEGQGGDSEEDRAVLVELYNATNGDEWKNRANWNSREALGHWYGVETNASGRVRALDLVDNNLAGQIPAAVGNLNDLEVLNLQVNNLNGPIPSSLGGLSRLQVVLLNGNDLTGEIPSSMGNLSNLTTLSIVQNRLSGKIPTTLGKLGNLWTMDLWDNELTGELPASIGDLVNLRQLSLSDNGLTGEIPATFGNLLNLERMALNDNQLTGSLPDTLGELDSLRDLWVGFNELTGGIPDSFGDLRNLASLTLGYNRLNGEIPSSLTELANLNSLVLVYNQLSGSIPAGLCQFEESINPQRDEVILPCADGGDSNADRAVLMELYNATDGTNWTNNKNWGTDAPLYDWAGVATDGVGRVIELNLPYSNLSGAIPSTLGDLTNLKWLKLDNNNLSGAIPSTLGDLTNLEELLLGNNDLSGAIPSTLGDLTNLKLLGIGNNNLSGAIPSTLGDLTKLGKLILGNNDLSDAVPSALGDLANLTVLDMGNNNLSGAIPSTFGDLANLNWWDMGNNNLSGAIPSTLDDLTNLGWLQLYNNQLSGSIPTGLCMFASLINPQQGGVILPCEQDGLRFVDVQLVPGDRQLGVRWTGGSQSDPDGNGDVGYDLRYRVAEGGSSAWIELLGESGHVATGARIGGLLNGTLYEVQVRTVSGGVEGEWSEAVTGRPVAAAPVSFGDAGIEDQRYTQYVETEPLVLPTATGGEGVLRYSLTPALPAGLVFEEAARTVTGAPAAPAAPTTYTYTATDSNATGRSEASLTFSIAVDVSPVEDGLRRDALAAQGRALLSSVTGVIGERFRPGASRGREDGMSRSSGGLLGALRSMVGFGTGQGAGGVAGVSSLAAGLTGGGPITVAGSGMSAGRAAGAGGMPELMSFAGRGGHALAGLGMEASSHGAMGVGALGGFGFGDVGADDLQGSGMMGVGAASGRGAGLGSLGVGGGLLGRGWSQSFEAALPGSADGEGASRYTVWAAGDRQSFSGTPEHGRYNGDVRTLYVGADGRISGDWLAGAAVGRSWGASDYTASVGGAASRRLTTGLTSVYPYVQGAVLRGLELWGIGGYGWGEARDGRGTDTPGEPADLTMTMGAAGLRASIAEGGGVAFAVVGGAGSLSLSTEGGGLTVAGLAAGVNQARLGVELSRAAGTVSPFVQVGGRYDGGDGQTGAGLELVAGLRGSTPRLDLEARGRWLSVHSAAGYGEYGAMGRLVVKSRPDGTGLRASLSPRWGAPDGLAGGDDRLLGGAGLTTLRPGAAWTPAAQALSLDSEVGYGWRPQRLSGLLYPMTSYRRIGLGGELTNVGVSYLSSDEAARRDLRMQFTLGRERWVDFGAAYQLAVAVSSRF